MTNKIPVPSFRRTVVKKDWVSTVSHTEPKVKESKYIKTSVVITTTKMVYSVFLSCGHTYYSGHSKRDKRISMDCFQCQMVWMELNNCDWDGNLKGGEL